MKIKNSKALKCWVNSVILIILFTNIALSEPVEGEVYAKDRTPIAYEHYKNGFNTVVIICPGFYNSKINRWMQKTVELISSEHDVIIFDFRGHGKSGGIYTWSAREAMDVNAIINYAKSQGYKKIGILGFSLGGASAINAISKGNRVDSIVLISCPYDFEHIDFHFWEKGMFEDLADNIRSGWQGKGAKTESVFMPKTKPIDSVKNIKKTPILFIHSAKDWVIKPYHSEKLFEAATGPKKLEIVKEGGHAERLIQEKPEAMKKLILDWFRDTLGTAEPPQNWIPN